MRENLQREDVLLGLAASSIKDNIEEEKCVVAQYRTTTQQKKAFASHLSTCAITEIPIEWVIDIADESNGWFYGTAYHYNDQTQMLHVMVPDKENPSFDGHVLLDHRTVHLIECADGHSDALFNKIIRDSVIKVKWDVEWFEEVEDGAVEQDWGTNEGMKGNWILSSARYYICIANQLLVEDKAAGDSRGFVILTADMNLKLINCHKGRGLDDFNRLIMEGTVQTTPEAKVLATQASNGPKRRVGMDAGATSPDKDGSFNIRKVSEISRGLRESLGEMLQDREKAKKDEEKVAKMFKAFTMDGNLEEGLRLIEHFDGLQKKTLTKENDDEETSADDAWYLAQKLEKSLLRQLRSEG